MKKRNGLLATLAVVVLGVVSAFIWSNRGLVETVETASGNRVLTNRASRVSTTLAGAAVASPAPAASAPMTVSPAGQVPTARGTLPYVLTSKTPLDKRARVLLESMGVKVVGSRSRTSFLIEADAASLARIRADGRFEDVTEFVPSQKVQPALAALVSGGAKNVDVSIVALDAVDRQVVVSRIEQGGGSLLAGCINEGVTIRAQLPAALVGDLAAYGDVRWLETFVRPKLMNDLAVTEPMMNVKGPVWETHGLTGAGQKISTSDSGIDTGNLATLHADLRNRVKEIQVVFGCYDHDANGHGTHTAGSIVGDGTKSGGAIKGTAYGAELYAWFCGGEDGYVYTPSTMSELYRHDGAWDTYIHSASWGSTVPGTYVAACWNHDWYVWTNPEFLPVFSAGNEGDGHYTIGAPGSAKNVLTVGATQSSRSGHDGGWGNGNPTKLARFSSCGPCADERIKPDVAAPGVGILSTRSHGVNYSYGNYNEFYAFDSGTSMSCPLTAGAMALVRQWLIEQKGFADVPGKRPTAALMKAVVMGGARGAPAPNVEQGWGRVDVGGALFPDKLAVKLVDRIPFASDFVTNIVIETTNAAPLDVQLVWVDYPGDPTADQGEPKLVNDLDLFVEGRGVGQAVRSYGNGGSSPDRLNNAESVHVAMAQPGKYVITVSCPTIVHDHSEGGAAALYIRGAFDPDAPNQPKPEYVRIRSTGKTYFSIDRALSEVTTDGETVEILSGTGFDFPFTVTKSCTIVATNANPAASLVSFTPGATLSVGEGTRVLFTNVVFAAGSPAISVATNGVVALAGRAEIGEISAVTNGCVELAGRLEGLVCVRCESAQNLGDTFGFYTCDYDTAKASAARILNAYEKEFGGEATDDGKLRWMRVPIDPSAAAAYHTADGGATKTYYIHFHKLFNEMREAGGEAVILRDCVLEAPVEVCNDMRIVCTNETGAATVTYAPDTNALISVEAEASLSVSNVVLSGAAYRGAIMVRGGGLTLESDTVITNCVNNFHDDSLDDLYAGAGGVTVSFDDNWNPGHATVMPGALITMCQTKHGAGGGIFVEGDISPLPGCSLDLQGGTIERCKSSWDGGGVHAQSDAKVLISGDVRIRSNVSEQTTDTSKEIWDNLSVANAAVLTLAGKLTAGEPIGLRCAGTIAEFGGVAGEPFGLIADGLGVDASVTNSATLFRSDDLPNVWHGAVGTDEGGNAILVWDDSELPSDEPIPEVVVARVIYDLNGSVRTNLYGTFDRAMGMLHEKKFDAPVTVELCAACDELTMSNGVDLVSSVIVKTEDNVYGKAVKIVRAEKRNTTISVLEGADLLLTNVWLYGGCTATVAVRGGALTMESGATISDMSTIATNLWSREHSGVNVGEGGVFTMRDGAEIAGCTNLFESSDGSQLGPAGGVAVEGVNSVFHLEGGWIHGCAAGHGGGVFINNDAKLFVSGKPRIQDNYLLSDPGVQGGPVTNANLSVACESFNEGTDKKAGNLILTGEFTGAIGVLEPRLYRPDEQVNVDTNVFGRLATDAGDPTNFVDSASRFHRDAAPAVTGLVVTNADPEAEALLVWSTAVNQGVYVAPDGSEYQVAGEPKVIPILPPTAVKGLVYNGQEQTGVVESTGYTLTGNVATDAGTYQARAKLADGYVWTTGGTDDVTVEWTIAKAKYDMSGVTFADASFEADGSPKSIYIQGELPDGVSVTYEGNGQTRPGEHMVTAKFSGDTVNHEPIADMTAWLTITGEDPEPQWDVITNTPTPIAFKSINRISDTEWELVITSRVEFCNYRLIRTDDLSKGFTETGTWEHAVGPAANPVWTTNVLTTGGAWFWRAEGAEGTNMVPHQVEN